MRDQTGRDGRRGRGPFVRRTEITTPTSAELGDVESKLHRHTQCFVKNSTGAARQIYEVLKVSDVLITYAQNSTHYLHHDLYDGAEPASAFEERVVILQQPADDGQIRLAAQAGVSVARLKGVVGKKRARTDTEGFALVANDDGPFVILHDPGSDTEGERFAKVRFGTATADWISGETASGTCPCVSHTRGSVDDVPGSSLEWTRSYLLAFHTIRIGVVEVVYDSPGVWKADEVEVTCNNEDETTDIYDVTMTASDSGNKLTVSVTLVTGGGYNGVPACCGSFADDNPNGFEWTFETHFPPDPLSSFRMYPVPSGIDGRICGVPPCELCVTPKDIEVCGNLTYAEIVLGATVSLSTASISAGTYVVDDSIDNVGTLGTNFFCDDIDASLNVEDAQSCSIAIETTLDSNANTQVAIHVTTDGDIVAYFQRSSGGDLVYVFKGSGELPLSGADYTLSKCWLLNASGPDTIIVRVYGEEA